jgi:hypothetical protein
MNAHVDEGTEPLEVALYIEKLLEKNLESALLFREVRTKNWRSFEMDSSSENL